MNVRKGNLIITYAILLQLITTAFILISEGPINVARLGVFYRIFPQPIIGALLMLGAVALSVIGLLRKGKFNFLLFLPQFVFLILTAGSALSYVITESYADGVLRPWQFIFIDQLPSFLTAVLYTFAVFDFRKETHDVPKTA